MAMLAIKTWGVNSQEYDMEKIMGDAKKEIMEDLQRLTINGASSRKFSRKKFTEFSKAMEDRNKLFRKAHALLVEEGAHKEEARALVKETLRQGRRPSGGSSHNSDHGGRGNSGG